VNSKGTQPFTHDPASAAGKEPPITDKTDLLIVGAGPAGLAAALAAAGKGVRITLVDEHPVPLKTMGEDIPLHFGGRMGTTVANHNAMLESILEANPKLADAIDAGVDVRLGTAVWGLFPSRPTATWFTGRVAGLADAEHAYLMRFEQVIVAAGRRDMGLAFEGWQRPGVMGASAAYRLATTYAALDARVAVLIGSDTEALQIANALMDSGIQIAAIVEQSDTARGATELLTRLTARGTKVFTRHVVQQADGDSSGVTAVTLVQVDENGQHLCCAAASIRCDTVLLGIAAIPSVELLEAAGCTTRFQADRGGYVAVVDDAQRTSLSFMLVAGDCAGTWPSKSLSEAIASREGRIAAVTALQALGVESADGAREPAVRPDAFQKDAGLARLRWVRASVLGSSTCPYVCQCEEVTAREILSLAPPRYLGWRAESPPNPLHSVASLDEIAAPHPDTIKRLTRAGMGPCQGRRCREQVAALVAIGSDRRLNQVPLATFRPPVRPLALRFLAQLQESPAMNEHWDSWFGMAAQWVPFWRVAPQYIAASRYYDGPATSE
jgi:thioredoxin reductase